MIYHPATNLFCPSLPDGFIPPSPPADQRMRARKRLLKHMSTYTGRVLCPGMDEYSVELAKLGGSTMTGGMQDLSGAQSAIQYGATSTLLDAAFYYEFETTSWTDSSTGGNNLTGNNSPLSNTGKIGNAVYVVSASSQSLSHASASAYDFSAGDMTVGCWAYGTTIANFSGLLAKFSGSTGSWYLFEGGSSTWRFSVNDPGAAHSDFADWGATPSTLTWYWVVGTYVKSTKVIGINQNNGTQVTTASAVTSVGSNSNPFAIGGRGDGTSFWNGRIDSAFGYKRILTGTEMSYLYNSGNGADPPF